MILGVLSVGAWAQAPKAPAVKDQGEYDIYTASTKETDPQKQLDLVKQWEQKYPDSDFKGQRTIMEILAYQKLALAAYGKTDAPTVDAGMKASKTLADNIDAYFGAENKPAQLADADWQKMKASTLLQATTILGYTAMTKKDDATAEGAFRKVLQMDPEAAQASYWLGTVILRSRKVERMPEALYEFARSTVVTGAEALPAAGKKAAEDYLAKAYAGYHGDASGLDDVKKKAAASALAPADFSIRSIVEIEKEKEGNEAEFNAKNPDIALWRTIRTALTAEGGDKYFADIKGSGIPPAGQAGFSMFRARVINQNSPKELLVSVDSAAGDATIQFDEDTTLKGTIDPGTQIKFKGVVDAFTKEPYGVTFNGLAKEDIEGLPATAFAADKPAGPAKPKVARPAPAPKKKQ